MYIVSYMYIFHLGCRGQTCPQQGAGCRVQGVATAVEHKAASFFMCHFPSWCWEMAAS